MSALSERPANPVVGQDDPARERRAARHRPALYTDDLVARTHGVLHAHPVQAPHAHARVTRLDTAPALRRARRGPGPHRRRRARRQRRRRQARRAAVPVRGHVPRPRRLLGARRDARGGPARRRGRRGRLRAAARRSSPSREAIAAESFQGGRPHVRARRRRRRPRPAPPTSSAASSSSPARSTSTSRPTPRWRTVDENGQVFVQCSTQHPTETQEIVAHVLGLPSHDVTVQCLRMGGGFGGKEMQPHGFAAIAALGRDADRPAGPAAAQPHPGHDDDRQAARLPRRVAGRLRRRRAPAGARGDADLRRRLEPRPVRAGAGPGAVPRRQRLLDPQHRRCTAGSRKTNKTSQTAFRGFGGPQGMLVIEDILGRCAPLLGHRRRPSCGAATSTSRARPRRTASRSGTPSGSRGSGTRCSTSGDVDRRRRRDRRVQRRPPRTPSGRWRSRR